MRRTAAPASMGQREMIAFSCLSPFNRFKHIVHSRAETIQPVCYWSRWRCETYARQALLDVGLVPSRPCDKQGGTCTRRHMRYCRRSGLPRARVGDWLRQLIQLLRFHHRSSGCAAPVGTIGGGQAAATGSHSLRSFWSGRELHTLLHPATLALHTLALRTSIPN